MDILTKVRDDIYNLKELDINDNIKTRLNKVLFWYLENLDRAYDRLVNSDDILEVMKHEK